MKRWTVVGMAVVVSMAAWAETSALQFPEAVEPLGLTVQKLSLGYNRLTAPPLDHPDFVLSDVDFALKRRFTEYSGDISGRMLGALGLAERVLRRDTPIVDTLVTAFPEKQQPDGHFGAPQDLATKITQERDMPILWGNGRLLRAMAEQIRRTDDPALRKAAVKLGDYVIATRPYYGKKENFEAVGGLFASGFTTCYPSLIDGLVQLGLSTGEQRFLDEARFIGSLSLGDPDFEKRHSHGRLTAYRGMLELDLATGTRDFVATVEEGVSKIAAKYLFPTGGIPELFDLAYDRDEGCSEADWVWVHLLLWQATRKPEYLDVAENVVRNHIYATQFANGGFGHYRFTTLALGDQNVRGGGIDHAASDSYWCCSMHDTQLLADLPSWGVVVDGDTIRVTWLAEVKAMVRVKDTVVTVTVEEQEPGSWTVAIAPERPIEANVALRTPGWTQAIRVDGEERPGDGGWVTVSRTWDGNVPVAVEMPTALRVVPVAEGQPTPARVYSGANLLCLPEIGLLEAFAQPGQVPSVTVCVDRLVDAHLPALVANAEGKQQQVLLGPMASRLPGGCRVVFDLHPVSSAEFDPLWLAATPPPDLGVPLRIQAANDGPYVLALDGAKVFQHGGWSESPTVEVKASGGEHCFAIAAPAKTKTPGVIGIVRYGGCRVVTQPEGWRAYVFDREPRPDELTTAALGPRDTVPIRDIGAFGTPPWEYVPGHFASTGARWIWAESAELPDGAWLVFATPFAVEHAG